jgi:predicted TIM-barrel fold metal-dependent hydrolase
MSHADTLVHLRAAIAASPVVDTHEHLRPLGFVRQELRLGLVGLFRNSYLTRSLRTADGSPNGLGRSWEPFLADDTWETVRDVCARVRFSNYYRWLMRALVELYELEGPDLTPTSWEYLSAELRRRHEDGTWLAEVLDRAKVVGIIWDPFWKAGTTDAPDSRCAPSFRINSSVVAFHPEASDFEGSNLIRDWAAELDMEVTTLAGLEQLIDRVIAMNRAAGSRSFKAAIAYDRTLAVDPVPRAEAERIFGRRPDVVTPAERKAFGDHIIRFFLERARDLGLVFQVHTGLARLAGSNPLLLEPLLMDFPEVVFDVFHGGYPWIHDVAALAHNHPNVRLNLTWLPQLSTTLAAEALKEWLEVVPQVDRITWGGDCFTPEEMYGSLLAAREAIARALAGLVEDGYLDMDTAIDAARSVLASGGARIYGLDLPVDG